MGSGISLVQPSFGATPAAAQGETSDSAMEPLDLEAFEFLSKEEVEEARLAVMHEGVGGLSDYLLRNLDKWQSVPVKVALVGESGVGKSSFINAVRNLSGDDEGAASVGMQDVTVEPTPYPHPINQELVFWDLPGIGTLKYPREKYCDLVDIKRYDLFLILSASRFTQNDLWLAREVEKMRKKYYFVRTKIDEDFANSLHQRGDRFNERDMLNKIRLDCQQNFLAAQLKCRDIYLVSNYDLEKWDYGSLMEDIIFSLPEQKRQAMVLSMGPLSKQIIEEKAIALKKRVWKSAVVSGVGSAAGSLIPVPLLGSAGSLLLDVGLLVKEVDFYLRTFGMDEASLQHLSERTHTKVDVFIQCLKSSSGVVLSRQSIRTMVMGLLRTEGAEAMARRGAKEVIKLIPVLGSAVNGGVAFVTAYFCLTRIISDFQRDAAAIVDKVIEVTSTAV